MNTMNEQSGEHLVPAPAVAGLPAGQLVVINQSGRPGRPIEELVNAAAGQTLWTVLSDTNVDKPGWHVQKVTDCGACLQLTLKQSGQRLIVGAATHLALDICRRSGELIWSQASEIAEGMCVLAIDRRGPASCFVHDRLHYAHECIRVNHVMEAPPAALYTLTVSDFAVGHESGLCVLVAGSALANPHRCPDGCIPTLSNLKLHPAFPRISVAA